MSYPLSGRCECGAVTYELREPPLATALCHCTSCQKLSTAPFSVTMILRREALSVSGELKAWDRSAASGNPVRCYFCPTCGNRIYHENPDEPAIIRLKPMTLDDVEEIEPNMHVWMESNPSWFHVADDLKKIARAPSMQDVLGE